MLVYAHLKFTHGGNRAVSEVLRHYAKLNASMAGDAAELFKLPWKKPDALLAITTLAIRFIR